MKLHLCLMCLGSLLIASNIENSSSAAVSSENEAFKAISTSVNKFSVDFFKTVAAEETENLICSPLSVSMVLSMAAFGANSGTAKEMRSALHLPAEDSVSKSGFKSLIDNLNNVTKVNLELANKIFVAESVEVKPQFKDITTNSFESEIENLNFGNAEAAATTINAWASAKTNNRIKDVIKPEDLTQAAMVLINAVYFKGNWQKKFKQYLTGPQPFYVDEKTTKDVPMMHSTDTYNYGPLLDLDATFIELPYAHEDENDATSMFIILPNTVGGLKNAESNLEKVDFKNIHQNPHMTYMKLYVPKFKTESSLNLQSTLTKLGMSGMFSNAADFTGIADSPPLKISKVLQKAFIEVNEEGSEAAAVTVGVVAFASAALPPREPITVKIDKPFIYAIVHGSTNTILFQGHITLPSI